MEEIFDHKHYALFGKTLIEKVVLPHPMPLEIPMGNNACFLYLLAGNIKYHLDDEITHINSKDSLLLNCQKFDSILDYASGVKSVELLVIHFHPDILKKIYDKELPGIFQEIPNKASNKSNQKIAADLMVQKYIEGLLFYFENAAFVNEDILILKIKEIILLLYQTQNAESLQYIFSQLFSPNTYTFKQIVESHIFENISIETLAQHTNLSLSSFKREFTKIYNDTPANYIKSQRLVKAAELLAISGLRISDIAYDCGFGDLSHFSKSFVEKFQTTPSQYRLDKYSK